MDTGVASFKTKGSRLLARGKKLQVEVEVCGGRVAVPQSNLICSKNVHQA